MEALVNLHGALLVRKDLEPRVRVHAGKARVCNDLSAPAAAPAARLLAPHPARDHGPAFSDAASCLHSQCTVRWNSTA